MRKRCCRWGNHCCHTECRLESYYHTSIKHFQSASDTHAYSVATPPPQPVKEAKVEAKVKQQSRPAIQNKALSKLMGVLESSECSVMALSTASNSSRFLESVASQDTGFGSMPSSMVLSMGNSLEISSGVQQVRRVARFLYSSGCSCCLCGIL